MTLRLLDLRPLGVPLPPLTNLSVATSRAGFSGGTATSAAQGKYIEGTAVVGFTPPLGPVDATAYRLAPPAAEPVVVNPSQMNLGPIRAGSGNLTARAAYGRPGTCDSLAGVESEASAALTDTAVLPAKRTVVGAVDNQYTRARTALVRTRGGGTGAEAETTSSLARLAIFDALRVRVVAPSRLRVVAGGSVKASTVEHQDPLIAVDLPDGRSVQLDQTTRALDFSLPGAGSQPVPGLPALPASALPDLLGAVPGGAAALPALGRVLGDRGLPIDAKDTVSPSAGSVAPPTVPGLPALSGVPAVSGLVGGVGKLPTVGQNSLILRLSGGEVSQEVTDAGVHAKAITTRLKLLLVRGDAVNTLIDLCIGVLEVAATAPAPAERGRGSGSGKDDGNTASGYGSGYGGEQPDQPTDTPTPAPSRGVAGGVVPTGNKLPLTGLNVTALLGAAVVILLAGRLLIVVARRRTS